MVDFATIIGGVALFTVVVMLLVSLILVARARLVSSGDVQIEINGDPERTLTVPAGGKLLNTLADAGIFLSSACGGGGTCAQCNCQLRKAILHAGSAEIIGVSRAKLLLNKT
jgi:Na+-transporting NADH:ubiquinone oxidoreductase subunit F